MKTLSKLSGIVGLIMFVFGLISYLLTHVNSLFFYVHIFGGLSLILFYFVYQFSATLDFLALMLIIILTVLGAIIFGTVPMPETLAVLSIPMGILFALYLGFNFKNLGNVKRSPFFIIPALCFAAVLLFKKNIPIEKHLAFIVMWGGLLALLELILGFKSIREGVFGKSTKYAVNVIVYSFLFLMILVVVNILGNHFELKKDLTENRINMLSEQSIKIAKSLDRDVNILAFYLDKNREKEMIKEFLSMYPSASKRIKLEFIDPDLRPQLAKQYGANDGDIIVECEGEQTTVKQPSEEAITSAIKQVTKTVKPMICFSSGHGEMQLDDAEELGLSSVNEGIRNEGYEVKTLESILEGVPYECDIFVVAGPSIPFSKHESDAIDDYLAKGGKGIFMLDPQIPDLRLGGRIYVLDTGLEKLGQKYGAKIGKNFVLQRHLQLFAGMPLGTSVQARNYGKHEIVEPLKNQITYFPKSVRSMQKAKLAGKDSSATEIIFSDPKRQLSWAETDIEGMIKSQKATYDPGDIEGPVPIAVVSELKPTKEDKEAKEKLDEERFKRRDITKTVWVGNSHFAANENIRSIEFNYDLFLNMLSWLWGEEEKISIRPKQLRTSTLVLTPEQSNIIFYVTVLAIPELILVFGLIIWIIRRKK